MAPDKQAFRYDEADVDAYVERDDYIDWTTEFPTQSDVFKRVHAIKHYVPTNPKQ